jgi:hypothetical protein
VRMSFYEARPTERGVGSVKFKGSLIKQDKVTDRSTWMSGAISLSQSRLIFTNSI